MARVTQEEIDQKIAAYGGPALVHSPNVTTKKIPNPAYGIGDGQDPLAPKELEVTVQRWKGADLAEIQAYQMPDGSWEVVSETPAPAKTPTATPASPAAQAAQGITRQIEGTPDPNAAGGFDNERPVWVTRDANGKQIGAAVPVTGKDLDEWHADREKSRNPGRKTDQQIKDEKEAETKAAEARNARPGTKIRSRTETKNGRTVTIETWRLPDGSTEDRESSEPGPKEEILTGRGPNGEDVRVIRDANGQVVRYEPVAGGKTAEPDPTDMPAPTFVVGDAAKDLRDFDTYLAGKIGVGPGKITQAKADQLRENRRKLWEVALGEQQGLVNTQKAEADRRGNERGQTLSDQGNRRNSATSIANQATSSLMPYMDKMGAGANGADFVAALRYLRDSSQDFVTSTGANAYTPNVTPGPALTTINNASIPAPGSTPAAPFLSPTRPNAIGLGNGVVPPAGAPAVPPPAAQPRQGASAVAEPPPGVNPGPARPAIAPTPAAVAPPTPVPDTGGAYAPQMGSVPQGATGNGTIMSPVPQQADGNERLDDILTVMGPDGSQMEMPRHEYNSHPAQGQLRVTNARPAAPSADGGFPPPQPAGPESNGTQSMMPTSAPFLSMTRVGPQQQAAYDPMPSVQSMIDDPEWDNEAVQQAYFEMYGKRLPMSA